MSYRNNSDNRPRGFSSFNVGSKSRTNSNRVQTSLNAVPPPPSINRPNVSNFAQSSGNSNRFSGSSNSVPPPQSLSKQGYHTLNAISQNAINTTYGIPTSRPKTEEDYFDEDEEDSQPLYQPGPDSPNFAGGADSDEEDPLDAFMKDLNNKTKTEESKGKEKSATSSKNKTKGVRQDIEEEDDEESYYRYIKENPLAGLQADDSDSELMEYDEDGNPIKLGKKIIDPLPAIDHSTINYQPFEKNFYEEHEEIKNMTLTQVTELKELYV